MSRWKIKSDNGRMTRSKTEKKVKKFEYLVLPCSSQNLKVPNGLQQQFAYMHPPKATASDPPVQNLRWWRRYPEMTIFHFNILVPWICFRDFFNFSSTIAVYFIEPILRFLYFYAQKITTPSSSYLILNGLIFIFYFNLFLHYYSAQRLLFFLSQIDLGDWRFISPNAKKVIRISRLFKKTF